MSAAGGNGTRIASKPGCPQDPSWSPDGKRLAFSDGTYCSKGGNPPSIYVKSGAGIARLTAGSAPDWGPKP